MILLICPHWRRRCIHCCTVRPEIERTTAFLQEHPALSYAHIALIAASAVPAAEDLAQTGCVSILFPDAGALPEIAEPVRVRVHAFRADALRAGTLHFEL